MSIWIAVGVARPARSPAPWSTGLTRGFPSCALRPSIAREAFPDRPRAKALCPSSASIAANRPAWLHVPRARLPRARMESCARIQGRASVAASARKLAPMGRTRQASGRLPACVQHCPGRALTLALPEDRLRTVEDSKIHWAVGLTEYKAKRCRCQESIG
ncbi:MAG: hypothetical protein FD137_1595 [Spirochaetes bacterium]|nr:MAG: hypothetical protein FD137_1595 [Spirochaetota bacterium]